MPSELAQSMSITPEPLAPCRDELEAWVRPELRIEEVQATQGGGPNHAQDGLMISSS